MPAKNRNEQVVHSEIWAQGTPAILTKPAAATNGPTPVGVWVTPASPKNSKILR